MDLATLTAALGRFGTGLSQHARLITLTSAHDVMLPDAPLAERVRGRESVNELYRFDVDALSTSTDLDLAGFIGEELTTTLLQPDGTRRAWHGICTAAEWLGADGGVARYRLRLEPALALLRLRRDSYIFQNRNVEGIVSELFADYPQLRFEFDVTQDMPPRAICTQYRESDYDFFVRLLASEGLSWRFEHDQADIADDGHARHRLVIFDGAAAFPDTPGDSAIRFHGVRATDSDDAIDAFRARRRVQANAVSISSWAPDQVLAPAAEQQSNLDAGELPLAQVYDGAGERIATDSGAAERYSRLMLQALELDNKLFEGEGAVRRLAAGHAFELTQHERYPDGANAFKVLWVEHEACNNVGAQISTADAGGVEPGTYRNRFGCVRDVVPVVPHATALPNPHTALGPQTALVVGLPDSIATTTRDHQVRVQFAWQRGTGGNAGSPYHDTDAEGCAPGDDRSGTWVRVAEALAGPNWGSQFTPRVGTEVLVDFIDNDVDRPLVVAQLYTGADAPPFAAGVDSGVDHAGTISGIHTQTFDGAGWNQWQLDDTPGQLRMRLATSMAATQLNLGYLVHQPAGSAQRGAYRGSGFELRTDAWAVVRGGDGVLITTSARPAQGAGIASTQMDSDESVGSLKAAQSLDKALRDAATAQHALSSRPAAQAQQEFLAQIDPAADGRFDAPVNGQAAAKAPSGSRELGAGNPVERFGKPVVLMDSQASINWATPASTVLFAGQQLHWTTQSDVHMTTAHTLSSVSAEATALYAHEGGIQAFAANGPVSLEAHTDQLEILADREVTVISVNDAIEVKAAKKIVLQAGQSSVTLDGGDITFACPGTFSVKGGQHQFAAGAHGGATPAPLPKKRMAAASPASFKAGNTAALHAGGQKAAPTNKPPVGEHIILAGTNFHEIRAGNKLMFLQEAVRDARAQNGKPGITSILYFRDGYNKAEQKALADAVNKIRTINSTDKYAVRVFYVDTMSDVEKYFNANRSMKFSDGTSAPLKVQSVSIYAHGLPGEIVFGYDGPNSKQQTLNKAEALKIKSDGFMKGATVTSYACRTGIAPLDGTDYGWRQGAADVAEVPLKDIYTFSSLDPAHSLAQNIADAWGVTVKAVQKRTDYEKIAKNAPPEYHKYDQMIPDSDQTSLTDWAADKLHGTNKYKHAYWNPLGAVDAPVPGTSPSKNPTGVFTYSPTPK